MFVKGFGIGTVIVAAVLVVALAVPAGGARTATQPASHETLAARNAASISKPAWLTALLLRSEALNIRYGLGDDARSPAGLATPAWMKALLLRSEALNIRYGLGDDARSPAGLAKPGWLEALKMRSDALNRMYGLGEYASGS